MTNLSGLVVLPMLAMTAVCQAAEMQGVDVQYRDGHYYVTSEVRMHVDQVSAFEIFLDWDIATEFSSVIIESRNIEADATGQRGYYVKNRACVLFFCKSTVRQGYVQSDPYSMIRAVADPEKSDFEVSDENWSFRADGDSTLVQYTLDMKPAFWIPPIIGPIIIKRKLAKDGEEAMGRIEAIAQQRAAERD